MSDHTAGVLSPAEALAADLHLILSREGRRRGRLLNAISGVILEHAPPLQDYSRTVPRSTKVSDTAKRRRCPDHLHPFLQGDLLVLKWKKNIFDIKALAAGVPIASLLRLDPREHAPSHGHGRRDITVVFFAPSLTNTAAMSAAILPLPSLA